MAGLTRSDYVDMLEEMYILPGRMLDMIMRDNAALAILEREQRSLVGGRYVHVPVRYGRPQGRSATFSDAQTNRTPSQIDAFQVTYVSNYGVATIDGDVMDDSGTNVELVADALEYEMDGAIANLRDDLAMSVFRNIGGARAQVHPTTAPSTTTLTLANPEDTVHFEKNMELVASNDDGADSGDALLNSGASATVTGVDRLAGTLTSDSNWTAQIAALGVSDYLFVEGDFANKMAGFDSWAPSAAPGATAFFGVARNVDTRLGGLRYDGTGLSIDEAILNACARVSLYRSKVTHGFINPIKLNALVKALESSSIRSRTMTVQGSGDAARFGFDAVVVDTGSGSVMMVGDPSCQLNIVWLVDRDAVTLGYSGADFVRLIDDDGNPFLRETSNDGVELRVKHRGNLFTPAPSHIMRVAID